MLLITDESRIGLTSHYFPTTFLYSALSGFSITVPKEGEGDTFSASNPDLELAYCNTQMILMTHLLFLPQLSAIYLLTTPSHSQPWLSCTAVGKAFQTLNYGIFHPCLLLCRTKKKKKEFPPPTTTTPLRSFVSIYLLNTPYEKILTCSFSIIELSNQINTLLDFSNLFLMKSRVDREQERMSQTEWANLATKVNFSSLLVS